MADSQKRFVRPKKGRIVGGVCLAIANYFAIEVVWVRIVWILLLLPGGLPGLLPYLILWLIIPSES
jgi:phage shock protein C